MSKSNNQPSVTIEDIIEVVNETEDGSMPFQKICLFFPSVNKSNIMRMIESCESNFDIESNLKDKYKSVVFVKTVLTLCKIHMQNPKYRKQACDGTCGSLHVCRTFLLCPSDFCPFSKGENKCLFGHSFNTKHNIKLLSENNLGKLNFKDVRILFGRPASRNETTMPTVCKYYNFTKNSCTNKKCKSLHLCAGYIRGHENSSDDCAKNHNIKSLNVKKVLELFAVKIPSSEWNTQRFLDVLKLYLEDTETEEDEDESDISDSERDASSYRQRLSTSSDHEQRLSNSDRMVITHSDDDEGLNPVEKSGNQTGACSGCKVNYRTIMDLQTKVNSLEHELLNLKTIVDSIQEIQSGFPETPRKNPAERYTGNPI